MLYPNTPDRRTDSRSDLAASEARLRADRALARALELRRALDELDRRRLAGSVQAGPAAPSPQPPGPVSSSLRGAVGVGRGNQPEDLVATRRQLAALGYAPVLPLWQSLPVFDPVLELGLRSFQAANGLAPDGWMRPGGETEQAIAAGLSRQQPASGHDVAARASTMPARQQYGPAPGSSANPLLHRASTPPAIRYDSFGRPLPPRLGVTPQTGPKDQREPNATRVAFAAPLARAAATMGAPIAASTILQMLQTNESLREQLRRTGIDPDDAISVLSEFDDESRIPIEQRLFESLSDLSVLPLNPWDLSLRALEQAYSNRRGTVQPQPAGQTPPILRSDSANRLGTAIDGGNRRSQQPPLASSLPNIPPEMPEDDGVETFPAEERQPAIFVNPVIDPDSLPDLEGFRPDDLPDLIEFFPDHGDLLADTNILESRGNYWTQLYNYIRKNQVLAEANKVNPSVEHINGARDNFGIKKVELWLKNFITGGKKGGSRSDFTVEDKVTGRRIHFNTVDTLADGVTETKREYGGGIRIIINMQAGDLYVQIPKQLAGKVTDGANFQRFISPLLKTIHKPWTPADPLSIESLEDLFYWYDPRKTY